jgi:hypothetical protein
VKWAKENKSRNAAGVSKSPTALVNVRNSTGIRHTRRSVPVGKKMLLDRQA